MLISEKQHAANCENAQKSTGPKTPEGKAAVRFNALTWSLRARHLMLPGDKPEEYQQLWNELVEEFRPQTHSERYYIEQIAAAEWRLTRLEETESRICNNARGWDIHFKYTDRIYAQRAALERSRNSAMRILKELQNERRQDERRAQPQPEPQPAKPVKAARPAAAPAPPPAYVMSGESGPHPAYCAPAPTDSR